MCCGCHQLRFIHRPSHPPDSCRGQRLCGPEVLRCWHHEHHLLLCLDLPIHGPRCLGLPSGCRPEGLVHGRHLGHLAVLEQSCLCPNGRIVFSVEWTRFRGSQELPRTWWPRSPTARLPESPPLRTALTSKLFLCGEAAMGPNCQEGSCIESLESASNKGFLASRSVKEPGCAARTPPSRGFQTRLTCSECLSRFRGQQAFSDHVAT